MNEVEKVPKRRFKTLIILALFFLAALIGAFQGFNELTTSSSSELTPGQYGQVFGRALAYAVFVALIVGFYQLFRWIFNRLA